MTELEPLRHLRFERLETRSLLAGEILDSPIDVDLNSQPTPTSHASGQDDTPRQVAGRVPASSELRGPQTRPQENRQQENRSQDFGRPGNGPLGNGPLGNGADRFQQRSSQTNQNAQSNLAQQTSLPNNNNVTSSAAPANLPTPLVGSSITSNQNPTPQNNRLPLATSAVDEILASLQSEVEDTAGSEDRDAVNSESAVTTVANDDDDSIVRIDATRVDDPTVTPLESLLETDTENVDDDGLFTPHSSLQLRPLENFSESQESDWQLNKNIFPRLQRPLRSALRSAPSLVDVSILDWFSGPGGLIDLQRASMPSSTSAVTSDFVPVQLESSIGYHRCLDLLASGVVEPISGPLLDSILASIEAMTNEETQPISEKTPIRISKLVYPAGAAIVAGSIAIAARRKHKLP
ncbi:hypothetical protein SH528x_003752 [Novipirellula sp. SH528]|uniref:hypothetical protein n=1 Tax=Novipirellula sp. SH528 TaxID=3454466 RepID=UPI003FA09F76